MKKPLFLAIGIVLGMPFGIERAQTRESQAFEVPVGGILMWWGRATDIPHGFEPCDGTVVSTPRAILSGPKPNLQERFVRGTRDHRSFVPQSFAGGGSDTIAPSGSTGTHALTLAELPSHSHAVPDHSHTIGNHSHAIPPHTHGIDHIHDVASHVHADGVGATSTVNVQSGSGTTLSFLTPDANGATQPPTPSPLRTGRPTNLNSTPNTVGLSTSTDGGGGQTSVATGVSTAAVGSGQGHRHSLNLTAIDNRPAYLEMIFIIRVK